MNKNTQKEYAMELQNGLYISEEKLRSAREPYARTHTKLDTKLLANDFSLTQREQN